MDYIVAKGFCRRYAYGPTVEEEVGEKKIFQATLPFCKVRLSTTSANDGGRPHCEAFIEIGSESFHPAIHLSSLQNRALRFHQSFSLNRVANCLSLDSRVAAKKSCEVRVCLCGNGPPAQMFWAWTWRDTDSPKSRAVVRAVHDTMRGDSPPEQLLDWLLQNDAPNLFLLEKVLAIIY